MNLIDYRPRLKVVKAIKDNLLFVRAIASLTTMSVLLLVFFGSKPLSALFALVLLYVMTVLFERERLLLQMLEDYRE